MFCPQCGTDSAEGQHYCRACGTNLKVVGRAVSLGDAISKSDGVPAKLKEIVSNIKIAQVTDEVARAMEKMKTEIQRAPGDEHAWVARRQREEFRRALRRQRRGKTAEERRERHLTKGAIKFFTGGGASIFLYVLFHSIQLHLPPDVVASVPFAIDPVVRSLWAIGLVPMLSGVGHMIAGLSIRPQKHRSVESPPEEPLRNDSEAPPAQRFETQSPVAAVRDPPASVTDRTTNILDRDRRWQSR